MELKNKTTTGELVAYYRKQSGLSQTGLAAIIGTQPPQLSRWESGERDVPEKWRKVLASHLKIDEEDLQSGAPKRSDVKRLYVREIDLMSNKEVAKLLAARIDGQRR